MGFNLGELQSLARELVSSRKVVGRLYENRAQLNSISMHLGESLGKMINMFAHVEVSVQDFSNKIALVES